MKQVIIKFGRCQKCPYAKTIIEDYKGKYAVGINTYPICSKTKKKLSHSYILYRTPRWCPLKGE
jgi:hypothetical protein